MNKDELAVWLMRTALEKILFSRCICQDKIDDSTQITCCPSCLAKNTLTTIDEHVPHVNRTTEGNDFIGT